MKTLFQKYKEFFVRNERYIASGALLFGFIIDNFTLNRIDLLFENLVLSIYLVIALLSIVSINLYEEGILKGSFFEKARFISPLALQFSFGALFSGFVIFYSQSATLVSSWPFIFLLITLLIGNEFFKKKYTRFTFRMSVFFAALFSFLIFYIPVITGMMGALMFLVSGAVSIAIIVLIIYVLKFLIRERIKKSKNALVWSIGGIFILINVFYFTNIIPPIPLSLKEAGVHYLVERMEEGDYLVVSETKNWYDFLIPNQSILIEEGDPVYVFSSVFAPTKLNTEIFHKWQYFDEEKDKWIESDKLGFAISGGRDGGFRGFTQKSYAQKGLWRVDVVTKRDQLIGRVKFKVGDITQETELVADIL